MLGHIGFSYLGLIYLLMLFIPNMLWTKNKPKGYDASGENRILLIFERLGQISTTCCALIFSDYNINTISVWSFWFFFSLALMIFYEICWVRYFSGKHTLRDFYRSFLGIPVPLATLPVMAFLLLGIYGKVIWLIVSVIVLGIGHIGIHIDHLKNITE